MISVTHFGCRLFLFRLRVFVILCVISVAHFDRVFCCDLCYVFRLLFSSRLRLRFLLIFLCVFCYEFLLLFSVVCFVVFSSGFVIFLLRLLFRIFAVFSCCDFAVRFSAQKFPLSTLTLKSSKTCRKNSNQNQKTCKISCFARFLIVFIKFSSADKAAI